MEVIEEVDWSHEGLDDALNQVLVEIEFDLDRPTANVSYQCDLCNKTLLTVTGLNKHKQNHKVPIEGRITMEDVLELWGQAVVTTSKYVQLEMLQQPSDMFYTQLIEEYNNYKKIQEFAPHFMNSLHKTEDIKFRSILIELLPLLIKRKEGHMNASPTTSAVSEIEKEISFYVGGSNLRAMYYQTRNSVLLHLKEDRPDPIKNLWGLNETGKLLFLETEIRVKYLLKSKGAIDPSLIAEEVIQYKTKEIEDWTHGLPETTQNEDDVLLVLGNLIAKYVRTRSHSFANRFTQLYLKKKHLKAKSAKKGKGPGSSFRKNLAATCT